MIALNRVSGVLFDEMGWLDPFNMLSRGRFSINFHLLYSFTFFILLTINPSDSKPFVDGAVLNFVCNWYSFASGNFLGIRAGPIRLGLPLAGLFSNPSLLGFF